MITFSGFAYPLEYYDLYEIYDWIKEIFENYNYINIYYPNGYKEKFNVFIPYEIVLKEDKIQAITCFGDIMFEIPDKCHIYLSMSKKISMYIKESESIIRKTYELIQ